LGLQAFSSFGIITKKLIFFALFSFLVTSCAPKVVKFYVTRPSEFKIENVKYIETGKFVSSSGKIETIQIEKEEPKEPDYEPIEPVINEFNANTDAHQIVRSVLFSILSRNDQYQILNTEEGVFLTGAQPDSAKTGLINAKVKFFTISNLSQEKLSYILVAKKQNLPLMDQLMLEGIVIGVVAGLEANDKGFKVSTPYVEKIAAMEAEFEFIRKSDKSKIIPNQVFRSYYLKKHGGDSDGTFSLGTSHVKFKTKQAIYNKFPNESFLEDITSEIDSLELAFMDPDEFLAKGGNLKQADNLPDTLLEIKYKLAEDISKQFVPKISKYNVETTVYVAPGDSIGINLINGNAYQKAINHLENLAEKSEADNYNLGLAYESVGERNQALKYYQAASDMNPENEEYINSVNRLK
jgi:tetratricopeptide (TPR) repeat protein